MIVSKPSHLLTCSNGHSFTVEGDELKSTHPYNFEIKYEGKCEKCGEIVKESLFHKGAGIYKKIK